MVVLVTGRWGFLGSLIAEALENSGVAVVGAGRPQQEIGSREFSTVLDQARPMAIVHCAGPASVSASISNPERDRQGSLETLRAVIEGVGPATRILLVSSAAVYGQPQSLPVSESSPLRPISPYGVHRVEAERLLLESANPSCIVRVFSAYGEGLRRQLLWDIARKAATPGPVQLHGTGKETRDFVHGKDVAAAVALLCAQSSFTGEIVNIGSGRETRVADLAERLLAALDRKIDLCFTGQIRAGDPERWAADIRKLESYGFEPRVQLETGIRLYAEWFRYAQTGLST